MAAQDDGTTLQVGGVACSGVGVDAQHAWSVARSVMVGTHVSTNRVHAAEAFACACVLTLLTLHGACKWTAAS